MTDLSKLAAGLSERVLQAQFMLARTLIHLGLRVMPRGRVRSELYALIDAWATKVRDTHLEGQK